MVRLKHESGVIKECPTGYSWTTLFFGCFVPLFRGDIKWAAILFLILVVAGGVSVGVGSFVADAVFAVFYNEMYIKDLLEQGYRPIDKETYDWLTQKGIIVN